MAEDFIRETIMPQTTTLKGKYSAAGEGNIYARANTATCKVTASDTDGTFEIFDEQHTVKYYLDREHLFARSIARDNLAAPAGWWNESGRGRFCYLSPGHTPDALGHPMMQRLLRNAMRWLLGAD